MSSASNLTRTDAPLWNTPEHHGPAVSVVTWLLIIAVVLAVASRTVTRYAIIKTLRWDDITALLAGVFAIGQCIAVSVESTSGLGSHADSLSSAQVARVQKSNYASLLLYVVTLGLAQISVCLHVHGLSPVKAQRQASKAVGFFVALWISTSFLVVAFQCKLPRVWEVADRSKCIDFLAFWTYFGILNIVTDLALFALPVPIVLKLQMSGGKKAVIIGCYATRFLVVAAVILQIYYLHTMAAGSKDLIYDLWIPVLCGQVVVTLSIISACFPFLKFLIDALETGMVRADARAIATQKYGSSGGGGAYYKAKGSQFKQGPSYGRDGLPNQGSHLHRSDTLQMNNLDGATGRNQGNPNFQSTATKGSRTDDDVDSQSSQTHIIRKVEWTLTEENSGTAR